MNKCLFLSLLLIAGSSLAAGEDEEIIKNLDFYQSYELIKDEIVFASIKADAEKDQNETEDQKREIKQ